MSMALTEGNLSNRPVIKGHREARKGNSARMLTCRFDDTTFNEIAWRASKAGISGASVMRKLIREALEYQLKQERKPADLNGGKRRRK